MTVDELIGRLWKIRLDHGGTTQVMVLDGFNGGGTKREINLGPVVREVSQADADETADCEGIVGDSVIVLGYGCY